LRPWQMTEMSCVPLQRCFFGSERQMPIHHSWEIGTEQGTTASPPESHARDPWGCSMYPDSVSDRSARCHHRVPMRRIDCLEIEIRETSEGSIAHRSSSQIVQCQALSVGHGISVLTLQLVVSLCHRFEFPRRWNDDLRWHAASS